MKRLKAAIDGIDLVRFRFWAQIVTFLVIMYGGHLGWNWGRSLPILACVYGDDGRVGICYLAPLQRMLNAPVGQLLSFAAGSVLVGFLTFVAWFIVLNKAWCGFVCPFGTIQDWLSLLRQRLGIRYGRYNQSQFRHLSRIKYGLLALTILLPLGISAGWVPGELGAPFCQICPAKMLAPLFSGEADTLRVDFSSPAAITLSTLGMMTTALFLLGSLLKKRFWCFFCPMGALQFLVARLALLRLVKDGSRCTRCGNCFHVCDMEIREIADDVATRDIMQDDCTLCLKCVAACPESGALKLNFLGKTVFEATEQGFLRRMDKGCQRDHNRA